jgi:hypothetical protein
MTTCPNAAPMVALIDMLAASVAEAPAAGTGGDDLHKEGDDE